MRRQSEITKRVQKAMRELHVASVLLNEGDEWPLEMNRDEAQSLLQFLDWCRGHFPCLPADVDEFRYGLVVALESYCFVHKIKLSRRNSGPNSTTTFCRLCNPEEVTKSQGGE